MDLDRFQHRYVVGRTGVGKSTFLINSILEDIRNDHGVLFIDPHGQDANLVLERIPVSRIRDVILFDPSEFISPLNIFEGVSSEFRPRVASAVIEAVRNVARYDALPTPVLNRTIRHAVLALFDMPEPTLLDIRTLLLDDAYRSAAIGRCKDTLTRSFWVDEYGPMSEREKRAFRASTLNNLDAFLDDPRSRNTLGYPLSAFKMPDILDGKILIARLPQGQLGIDKTRVLGSLLIAMVHTAALSRQSDRPFHVHIDECHHFGTGSLIEMLSGIRKFNVSLTLAHQYMKQLSAELQSAIMGNVGTKIVFRVGIQDAEVLEHEFGVNNILTDLALLQPGVARISTPFEHLIQRTMPTLPQRSSAETRRRIEAFSRRHHSISTARIEGWRRHCQRF